MSGLSGKVSNQRFVNSCLTNSLHRMSLIIPSQYRRNIIVGVVYRPPNQNLRDFMNSPDSLLASISKENKICYVLGDWNLDLINHHCHDTTGELLETMYSRMFFPLITRRQE